MVTEIWVSGFPWRPGPCGGGAPRRPVQPALPRVLRADAHARGGVHLHGLRHPDHLRLPAWLPPPLEHRAVPHRQGEGGAEGEEGVIFLSIFSWGRICIDRCKSSRRQESRKRRPDWTRVLFSRHIASHIRTHVFKYCEALLQAQRRTCLHIVLFMSHFFLPETCPWPPRFFSSFFTRYVTFDSGSHCF